MVELPLATMDPPAGAVLSTLSANGLLELEPLEVRPAPLVAVTVKGPAAVGGLALLQL